ncbi:MAG: sulfotransferase [Frankiaceae bacterium]
MTTPPPHEPLQPDESTDPSLRPVNDGAGGASGVEVADGVDGVDQVDADQADAAAQASVAERVAAEQAAGEEQEQDSPAQDATEEPETDTAPEPAASPAGSVRQLVKRAIKASPYGRRAAEQRLQRDVMRLSLRDANERLESMVTELHRLRALGFGRPERDQPGLGYVFIVTYGRTGSTLLQGILTHIPGYLVRGENGGIVYQLYRFHKGALVQRDRLARKVPLNPTHPWYGIDGYPEDLALRQLRQLVLDTVIRPTSAARMVGFKEIHWDVPDLHDYLTFLRAVFPGARFVVNTRDVAGVVASKWWANRPNALAEVTRLDEKVRKAAAFLGDAAYHVHYDDYVADPTSLRGLFEWLDAPFSERQVRAIMSRRHSY